MTFETIRKIYQTLQEIVFLYPLLMSWVWMVGGILFYIIQRQSKMPGPDVKPPIEKYYPVSVIVPCHNEEEQVDETIRALAKTTYPSNKFEVIAVNDGSTDNTAEKLNALAGRYPLLKVIHLAQNKGKAIAMKTGALIANGRFLICVDGDALLEPNAVSWLVFRLLARPNFGAVTGNPRIRNRTTLLGKLQVGEFSSIVGLIKRAQVAYGHIFTVSGVVVAFRKRALHEIGYWGSDMLTDDVDVSWRLQKAGWGVRYEPNALCWILMPETLRGLWSQRLRWAQGGAEVALKHGISLFSKGSRGMLPILFDYIFSLIWATSVLIVMFGFIIELLTGFTLELGIGGFLPSFMGMLIGMTFLIQSAISLWIERHYEPGLFRFYGWIIWYPIAYWLIMAMTCVIGFFKALLLGRKKLAVWISPDRGVR